MRPGAPSSIARSSPAKMRQSNAVGHLLSRFFDNSAGSLALRLIANERPSNDELSRLKALIEQYEENG